MYNPCYNYGFCSSSVFVLVTVESVGAMAPDVIFKEAVKVLKNRCLELLNELNDF